MKKHVSDECWKNPKYDYYKLLLELLKSEKPLESLLAKLFRMGKKHQEEISVTLDFQTFYHWHQKLLHPREVWEYEEYERLEQIGLQIFSDLSSQMRTKAVSELFSEYREFFELTDGVFIHPRKVTPLCGKFAAVTVVVDDLDRFIELLQRGCDFSYQVRYCGSQPVNPKEVGA